MIWQKSNEPVAVYQSLGPGDSQIVLVFRYKTGWKERDAGFRKSFMERYEAEYSDSGYNEYLSAVQQFVEKSRAEMLSYRAEPVLNNN